MNLRQQCRNIYSRNKRLILRMNTLWHFNLPSPILWSSNHSKFKHQQPHNIQGMKPAAQQPLEKAVWSSPKSPIPKNSHYLVAPWGEKTKAKTIHSVLLLFLLSQKLAQKENFHPKSMCGEKTNEQQLFLMQLPKAVIAVGVNNSQ